MTSKDTFYWNSAKNGLFYLPKWVENLVAIIGIPLILWLIYKFIFPLLDNPSAIITFAVIVAIGVAIAFYSNHVGDISLHIHIDSENITCKFHGKTTNYRLSNLDWEKVKITNELNKMLILKELGENNERPFPLMVMSNEDRRKLWKLVTKYRNNNYDR